jgi:hypothetical protein
MSQLLEDLAEETSASNRRTAERLDAEAQELERLWSALSTLEDLRGRVIESARQSTEHVISKVPQAEGVWRLAVAALRTRSNEECVRLLQHLLNAFESGQRLVQSPRAMWKLAAEHFTVQPEHLDELERVERRFKQLAGEARAALQHRTQGWEPADPERLTQGLQMAREGKTIKAEDAIARFRRPKE